MLDHVFAESVIELIVGKRKSAGCIEVEDIARARKIIGVEPAGDLVAAAADVQLAHLMRREVFVEQRRVVRSPQLSANLFQKKLGGISEHVLLRYD